MACTAHVPRFHTSHAFTPELPQVRELTKGSTATSVHKGMTDAATPHGSSGQPMPLSGPQDTAAGGAREADAQLRQAAQTRPGVTEVAGAAEACSTATADVPTAAGAGAAPSGVHVEGALAQSGQAASADDSLKRSALTGSEGAAKKLRIA